jgi:hypothetical protein
VITNSFDVQGALLWRKFDFVSRFFTAADFIFFVQADQALQMQHTTSRGMIDKEFNSKITRKKEKEKQDRLRGLKAIWQL